MDTFDTRDIALATYLRFSGFYCIGTIPANNKYRPNERLWIFEKTPELLEKVDEFSTSDPQVPVKKAFSYASILKNLLNDKDEFDDGEKQKN